MGLTHTPYWVVSKIIHMKLMCKICTAIFIITVDHDFTKVYIENTQIYPYVAICN